MISNILDLFNSGKDFYTEELKILFKEEYEKKIPSQYMWAFILDVHPGSIFSHLSPKVRREILSKDLIGSNIEWDSYSEVIDKIKRIFLSKVQRLLVNWETKLEERDYFLNSTPYNADNFDLLEKAMKETHKMWQNYQTILKDFKKEEEAAAFGGGEDSLSEKGII